MLDEEDDILKKSPPSITEALELTVTAVEGLKQEQQKRVLSAAAILLGLQD